VARYQERLTPDSPIYKLLRKPNEFEKFMKANCNLLRFSRDGNEFEVFDTVNEKWVVDEDLEAANGYAGVFISGKNW